MMKKILILANSSGGLYDFRNELVLALLKQYEVAVSVPDETRAKELEEEGCQVIMTPINRRGMNPVEDLKLLNNYKLIMKDLRPDVVLTYTIKPNIYGGLAAKRNHIPYITNITGLGTTFEKKGMVKKIVVFLYRKALIQSRCVFFQNQKNQDVFAHNRIHGKKFRLIPGSGVNIEKHKLESFPVNRLPRFLFVGRLMKEKGIDEFLQCAKQYANRAEFDIIGYCEEDYEETIKQMSTDGLIHFLGFQKEVHNFYKQASAVIVPSYHEGMSNVILEAASTGRPVLASRIPGCMEAVEDGITGILFQERNEQSLALAINKFIHMGEDKQIEMGVKARKKMEREFNRDIIVAAYMQEINSIRK